MIPDRVYYLAETWEIYGKVGGWWSHPIEHEAEADAEQDEAIQSVKGTGKPWRIVKVTKEVVRTGA